MSKGIQVKLNSSIEMLKHERDFLKSLGKRCPLRARVRVEIVKKMAEVRKLRAEIKEIENKEIDKSLTLY